MAQARVHFGATTNYDDERTPTNAPPTSTAAARRPHQLWMTRPVELYHVHFSDTLPKCQPVLVPAVITSDRGDSNTPTCANILPPWKT